MIVGVQTVAPDVDSTVVLHASSSLSGWERRGMFLSIVLFPSYNATLVGTQVHLDLSLCDYSDADIGWLTVCSTLVRASSNSCRVSLVAAVGGWDAVPQEVERTTARTIGDWVTAPHKIEGSL